MNQGGFPRGKHFGQGPCGWLKLLAQRFERGPAWVRVNLVVLVRLPVQVAPADRAETGALGPAQDLLREREDERVARPCRQVEHVVREVRRPQLLRIAGTRRLVLPSLDRHVECSVCETPHAGPMEPYREVQPEDRAGARTGYGKLRLDVVRNGKVTLPAEFERGKLDLLRFPVLFPRPQAQRAKIERGHTRRVTSQRARAGVAAGTGAVVRPRAGRTPMISATATRIIAPATTVRTPMGSLSIAQPRNTATTGFT
jgi:hypothetical protein